MNPYERPADSIPLGLRLRALRLAHNRSVKSLAAALHVTTPTIYQWEVGTRMPTVDKVEAYLRTIGESLTIGAPQ